MLTISLFIIILTLSFNSFKFTNFLFSRILSLVFIYSALLSINGLHFDSIASGINIFNGIFVISILSNYFEILFLFIQAIIIFNWISSRNFEDIPAEIFIIILIFTIGANILISCSDFISFFICIEILTFSSSILISIFNQNFTIIYAATKYFIVNGFNSSFILLTIIFINYFFGLFNFQDISDIINCNENSFKQDFFYFIIFIPIILSITIKIAIFPNHSISLTIYDQIPIILTNWIIIMPKLPILMVLIELLFNFSNFSNPYFTEIFTANLFDNFISITILFLSIINIIIGAIFGISQIRIKRLLFYSGINHIGFILLAISNLTSESLSVILFYIFQYSINSIDIFLILLCFNSNILFINQINAQINKFIYFIFSINIFSMCGIPPLIGFFAKMIILQVSLYNEFFFIILFSIITSIINSSYYLKILKILFFTFSLEFSKITIYNLQGFFIILLTFITFFFIFNADIWLNFFKIISFSIFYYLFFYEFFFYNYSIFYFYYFS